MQLLVGTTAAICCTKMFIDWSFIPHNDINNIILLVIEINFTHRIGRD